MTAPHTCFTLTTPLHFVHEHQRIVRDLGVPANRISAIVNRKRAITADTALRLGTYFQVSLELWLDLQPDYDLRLPRNTAVCRITAQARPRAARGARLQRYCLLPIPSDG